jgi:hypothetical protein
VQLSFGGQLLMRSGSLRLLMLLCTLHVAHQINVAEQLLAVLLLLLFAAAAAAAAVLESCSEYAYGYKR